MHAFPRLPAARWHRLSGLVLLLVFALGWPLSGPPGLVGWSGQARGEFESWWWLDWWLPHLAACRWESHLGHPLDQLWALLCIPRDLDIGNYLEGLLLALPCKALKGPASGHNLHATLVLLLNAEASVFLAKSFLDTVAPDSRARPWRVALVTAAALAMALNPVTLWDLAQSRFGQALIAPWLLLLAFCFRALRDGGRASHVGIAATFAITALVYWYAAFFAALFVLPLLFLARSPSAAAGPTPRIPSAIALALLAGFVATLPFGLPFLAGGPAQKPEGGFPPLEELVAQGIPDASRLGPPGPTLILAQSIDLLHPLRPPGGPSLSWAWAVLGLAGLGLGLARSSSRRASLAFLVALAAWIAIAAGPYARVGDIWHPVALPYQLLYRCVPFLWRLNWPARTLPFIQVALVLLSLHVAGIPLRADGRRGNLLAGLATGVLALLAMLPSYAQGLLPLPTTPVHVSGFYTKTVAQEEPGGVIEASFDWNSSQAGYFQVWHGQKVLGNLGHCPPTFGDPLGSDLRQPSSLRQHPLIRVIEEARLESPSLDAESPGADPIERDLALLRAARYRWVVVHATYGGASLPGSPALADALTLALGRHPDVRMDGLCAWKLY